MKQILSFILSLLLISNCYGEKNQKLTILLDWFANPNHAPLFVAKERGFFKEQGLDVELIAPSDPADPPKLVAAGKADIAITYEPQFMQQVDNGLPLIRIGTLIDKPLNCLVVLKDSSIKSIKDLKGKTIGYSNGNMDSTILKVMLNKNNLQLSDIKQINVRYSLTQALLSRKVDAVTGIMRNFELLQMELAGFAGRAFYPEQYGIPTYSELILVVRTNQVRDSKYKRFLIALKKGNDYLQKHPLETWDTFAKSHPELTDELNRRAWLLTLPYFAKNPEQFTKNQWAQFANFMFQNHLIKKVQPIQFYAIDLMKD
ncbi:MAG: ABC transporter substrate-binding protein [Gammaproteobacteria bacterium]